MKRKKEVNLIKLWDTKEKPEKVPEPKSEERPIVSYWHNNLTVHIVPDTTVYTQTTINQLPHLRNHIRFSDKDRKFYMPIVWVNRFWQLQEDIHEIVKENVTLPLRIQFSTSKNPKKYFSF